MLLLNKYFNLYNILIVCCIGLFKGNIAQNLILNGSFEHYTEDAGTSHCVTDFSSMYNWSQLQSPDVFTKFCTFNNHYGSPNNRLGNASPVNGNAYIGMGLFILPYETKEYIFQHLNTPLIAGKSYYVSFYVSKADRIQYAVKNIGAYFSVAQPTTVANAYISTIPQVENQAGYLTDTIVWTKIEGYFIAQGGEEYITIGNFNSNADTDTLNSGTTNPIPFDAGTAYYYVDSVSLYDSLDYITNVNELNAEPKFNLYPNPGNGKMYLDYDLKDTKDGEMRIFDVTGKVVGIYHLHQSMGKLEINEENLNNGVYYYSILSNGRVTKTDKIIIIK